MPTPQSPFWGRPCKARRPGACKPAVIANQCLAPAHTSFLLHVIASYVLAPADTSLSSACHCEPVRTLAWQSVSPQGNLASWPYFGQIRSPFRIRPKYYSPLCPAARSTDCHVASLLAMTCRRWAGVRGCKDAMTCRNLPGACVCQRALPGYCRKASLQSQTRCRLQHVIANQCAHWCGNPFPRRNT